MEIEGSQDDSNAMTTKGASKSRKQKIVQNVLLLFAIFTVLNGYSLISPFFPQEARKKGMTDTEIGVIFAFFPAIVVVTAPIYGSLVCMTITKSGN